MYWLIKIWIRLALQFFSKRIVAENKQLFLQKGPLLITANHPNSFFDAVVIGALFKHPVLFLARGDAFDKAWKRKLLSKLNMVPIYRLREGKENLHLNEFAFAKSKEVLQKGGIVLIFIEGICKHTQQLQPFKKGAARIAFSCWKDKINLKVLPLAISYSSLFKLPLQIEVKTLNPLNKKQLSDESKDEAKNYLHFNTVLFNGINGLLNSSLHFSKNNISFLQKALAFANFPFLFFLKKLIYTKTKNTVFYHSILFAVLWLLYPLYFVVFVLLLFFILHSWLIALLIAFGLLLLLYISLKL